MEKDIHQEANGNPWKRERRVFGVLAFACIFYGILLMVIADAGLWALLSMTVLGLLFLAVFGRDCPVLKWTEQGITYRFFLKTRFVRWSELIQAGVIRLEIKKATGIVYYHYRIALLLPGGIPKKPGQPFRVAANSRYTLRLPHTPQMRALVIANYGLLDFDESASPSGYSIVVD